MNEWTKTKHYQQLEPYAKLLKLKGFLVIELFIEYRN